MRSLACKVAFAVAAACSLAGTAFGQPASNPPADIWSRPTLTGDWGGLRTWLDKHGITITLDYTVELLANLQGGIKRGEVVLGLFQPQVDVDLEKLWGLQGARFRAGGIFTHGPAFSPDYLGNILAASNIEVQRPVNRLYELWYEQNAFNDRFSVRAGLLRVDTEFITSETAFIFMNSTLGWKGWLATVLPSGGPAYPFSAPAVRIKVKPRDDVYLQAAVFSGDPAEFDGSNQQRTLPTGTIFSFRGGAYAIAELGYTPNQQKGAAGLPGNYKIGYWYHTSRHFGDQRFDDTGLSLADPMSSGIPLEHTGNWGIYGVIDQMLYRVPGTDDQGLSAFFRFGSSPNDRNLISFYFDGGVVYKGLIPGRPDDKIGLAAAYARIGSNARALDRDVRFFSDPTYPVRIAEGLVELTYQAKLAPWWTVQGDLQYIIRPGGGVLNQDGTFNENAWVAGLRTNVLF
jgi:porin